MKRFFIIAVAAVMMTFATNSFAQMQIGAGYLRGTDKITTNGVSVDPTFNGVYAGFSYNMNIAGGLGIAPGIYWSYLFSNDSYENIINSKLQEHFANVPVYLNFRFGLGEKASLMLFAGPTAQIGISSKINVSVSGIGADVDRYKDSHYSRTDLLAGGGIGLNIGKIQFTVGYDQGLFNLDTSDDGTVRHKSYAKAGIAYLF